MANVVDRDASCRSAVSFQSASVSDGTTLGSEMSHMVSSAERWADNEKSLVFDAGSYCSHELALMDPFIFSLEIAEEICRRNNWDHQTGRELGSSTVSVGKGNLSGTITSINCTDQAQCPSIGPIEQNTLQDNSVLFTCPPNRTHGVAETAHEQSIIVDNTCPPNRWSTELSEVRTDLCIRPKESLEKDLLCEANAMLERCCADRVSDDIRQALVVKSPAHEEDISNAAPTVTRRMQKRIPGVEIPENCSVGTRTPRARVECRSETSATTERMQTRINGGLDRIRGEGRDCGQTHATQQKTMGDAVSLVMHIPTPTSTKLSRPWTTRRREQQTSNVKSITNTTSASLTSPINSKEYSSKRVQLNKDRLPLTNRASRLRQQHMEEHRAMQQRDRREVRKPRWQQKTSSSHGSTNTLSTLSCQSEPPRLSGPSSVASTPRQVVARRCFTPSHHINSTLTTNGQINEAGRFSLPTITEMQSSDDKKRTVLKGNAQADRQFSTRIPRLLVAPHTLRASHKPETIVQDRIVEEEQINF